MNERERGWGSECEWMTSEKNRDTHGKEQSWGTGTKWDREE